MGGVDDSEEELVAALVDELTRARQRGLDRIDGNRQLPRLEVPRLESLAREYANDQDSNRITLIRRLLDDALKDWDRRLYHEQASFVRRLFFAADGSTPGPGAGQPKALLDKVKTDLGLDDVGFNNQRVGVFGLFSRFLVRFVRTPPEPPPPPPPPTSRMPWLIAAAVLGVVVLIGGIVWFVSRGDEGEATPRAASTSSPNSPQVAGTFTFDDLGGASPIINVYPGVSDSPADKIASGTFSDGQEAPAICKTTGRIVTSDPSAGEEQRESDVWIEVVEQAGVTHYASLTYGIMEPDALAELPEC